MIIKALTLSQPYATLVKIGAKRIETRSYSTTYRGPLGIHAAKLVPDWARAKLELPSFREALEPLGVRAPKDVDALPRGALLGVVELVDVVAMDSGDERLPAPGSNEWEFGVYGPGRFAWFLELRQPPFEPIPCSGALSLWTLKIDLAARSARRLTRADRGEGQLS
jgi:hypothetical protein